MRYPHLFARLYNMPLLLHPDKAAVIEGVFRAHLGATARGEADVELGLAAANGPVPARDKSYVVTDGGVAIIPVIGTLVQRSSWMDAASGMTGYGQIGAQLDEALADPDVKGILLEIDSGGGEANGVFDLADRIFEAREQKPVWAIANEQAYSAAYAIASSAEKLFMPRTAGVGSVGVIALHVDQSGKNEKTGLVYTAIHAGAKKNDLSRHAPLSDGARADLQAEIDRLYGLFTDTVARNRGLEAAAVRATEAGLLNPEQAVATGFADGIATFAEVVAQLEDEVAPKTQQFFPTTARYAGLSKEARMKPETQAQAAGTAELQFDPAPHLAQGRKEGALAERTRIAGILGSDEAKGREAMASTFALETDMDPETAKKLLAKSPIAVVAQAPTNPLAAAMAGVANPKVGADSSADVAETTESQAMSLAMRVINAGKQSAHV
jgi:signal peptide peptidase SppA